MRRNIGTCIIAMVSFVAMIASSSYAIRPLYTEDYAVTPKGKVIIETGALYLSRRDNTGINEEITSVKYGFANGIDASLDIPYASQYSSEGNYDGMSNGTFKLKYNPYDNGGTGGASFLLGYQVDTANPNNISEPSAHNLTTLFIFTKDLGGLKLDLNLGYMFDDEPGGQPDEDFNLYNAALTKPLSDIINLVGEVQYSRNTYTGDIVGETAIGFNYKYTSRLILDAAVGCGLNENSSSSNLAFGLTYLVN